MIIQYSIKSKIPLQKIGGQNGRDTKACIHYLKFATLQDSVHLCSINPLQSEEREAFSEIGQEHPEH